MVIFTNGVQFDGPRIPAANLTAAGSLVLTQTGPDTENAATTVINQGDACATEISGVATVRSQTGGVIATLGWSLPPALVLHPGESVTVTLGELNRDQLTAAGANGTYSMAFTFKTGGC